MSIRFVARTAHLVILLLLLTSAARAQDTAVAPSHLAAARELLDAMQIDRAMSASAAVMIEAQVAQMPELTQVQDVMLAWARKYLTMEYAGDQIAAVYAGEFTEGELRELTAFYRSPLGTKVAVLTPVLTEKSAAIGAAIAQQYSGELERMLQEQMAPPDSAATPPSP